MVCCRGNNLVYFHRYLIIDVCQGLWSAIISSYISLTAVGILSKFQIAIYVFALAIVNAVSPVGAAEQKQSLINYEKDGEYIAQFEQYVRTYKIEVTKTGNNLVAYVHFRRYRKCDEISLENGGTFKTYCGGYFLKGNLENASLSGDFGSEEISFIPMSMYEKYLENKESISTLSTKDYAESLQKSSEVASSPEPKKVAAPASDLVDYKLQSSAIDYSRDGSYFANDVVNGDTTMLLEIEKTGDSIKIYGTRQIRSASRPFSCEATNLKSDNEFASYCTVRNQRMQLRGNLKNAIFDAGQYTGGSGEPITFIPKKHYEKFLVKQKSNTDLTTREYAENLKSAFAKMQLAQKLRAEKEAAATAKAEQDRKAKAEQDAAAEKERARSEKEAKIAAEEERKRRSVSDGKALESLIGKEGRKQVQFALKAEGYLTGNVDGVFGNSSREAIRQFQSKSGSFVSGYLSASDAGALKNIAENSKEFIAAEKKRKEKALADAKKANEAKVAAAAEKKRKRELARKATEKKKDQQARKARMAAKKQAEKDDKKRQIAAKKAEKKAENEKLFLQNEGIATRHIEVGSKFVKVNPTHSSLIDLVTSITSLRTALKTKSGETLLASVSQHEELIKSVKDFSEFVNKQDAAKQQEIQNVVTQLESRLVNLGTFLSTFVADNISDEIEVVSKVVPLLKSLKRDRSDFKPDQYRKKISEIELVVRENEPLHRSFQKFKSEMKAKHDVAEKKRIEEVQDREDAKRQIASQEEEKEFQARFAKLKSKISKKQAEKNEKDRKVARRKMVARLLEKQKLIKFSGKVVFAVSSAEDEIKISPDEDESGKLTGFDVLAGCRYTFLVKNLTKYNIKVFGFSVGRESIGKTAPVQMNTHIPAGESYKGVSKHEQVRFASWTKLDQKEEPSVKQQKEILDKLGCNAQKGTIFLEYSSAKNFMKFPRKARFKDRSIVKFVAADESAAVPIRFHKN
jgi:peptidoglycan hydrolase-like protein with peptidoglycan-binding domain